MKKVLILTAALVLAASSCFAAASASIDFTNGVGLSLHGDSSSAGSTTALIGKTSTGVGVAWQTSVTGYALMTQHKSGTKAYGSSYDSTALYQTTAETAPGTAAYNSGGLNASDTSDFTTSNGWKAM